jgi:hypothetical protein
MRDTVTYRRRMAPRRGESEVSVRKKNSIRRSSEEASEA